MSFLETSGRSPGTRRRESLPSAKDRRASRSGRNELKEAAISEIALQRAAL